MPADTSDDTRPASDEAGETASAHEADDAGETVAETRTIHLASWTDRFIAWLVDVIVVGAVLSAFGEFAGVVTLISGGFFWVSTPFVGLNGLALWAYWTLMEGSGGQSAGKMVMNIEVADERGDAIEFQTAAIESFGKAFILPIDCLVGWLAWEGEYVRLFNRLSDTIVVQQEESNNPPAGVEYVKPDE